MCSIFFNFPFLLEPTTTTTTIKQNINNNNRIAYITIHEKKYVCIKLLKK
jgi:hypothetical protein